MESKWLTHALAQRAAILSLLLRIFLIAVGSFVDNSSLNVKYTDIDYNVFTDASRLMWDGRSPYDRDTYRYPPLLAFILLPNVITPLFGKILFSIADVGILWQHFYTLELRPAPKLRKVWVSVMLALNFSFAVISTRGSSDSIHNFLILSALRLSFTKNYALCGILLGLTIHLRIYPVIFIPALVLHILKPGKRADPVYPHDMETVNNRVVCGYLTKPSPNEWVRKRTLLLVPLYFRNLLIIDSHLCSIEYSYESIKDSTRFLASACASFSACTMLAYYFFGWQYLENAVLYHFKRLDFRHNFSPHFYWLYLSDVMPSDAHSTGLLSVPSLLTVSATVPQALLFCLITLSMARRDLSICFLLLTFTLVAFNKVCTAQYFTWFACFLPTVLRSSLGLPLKKFFLLIGMWTGSLLFWLKSAHGLEFAGFNNFVWVWLCSLVFHIFNCKCMMFVIANSKFTKRVK